MSSDTTDFNRNTGLTVLYKTASVASLMVFLAGVLRVQQSAIKPTSGNFKGFEKLRAPYTLTDILSGCLAHLNSLTCELQHCTRWKRKHKCLCHKHGILHLDIQEGILQWILGWLSSRPWHRNRSGVHLWVQNLGKIRLNAFIAEWSYREKNE